MTTRTAPLAVPIPVAGALLGESRATAYRLNLPTLDLPGRKKVALAVLERMVGKEITADQVEAAGGSDRVGSPLGASVQGCGGYDPGVAHRRAGHAAFSSLFS